MLQWRGGGRSLAHDPAALREIGYEFEERAAIHEHDGGLPREEAARRAWAHVMRQAALVDVPDGRRTRSRGATEHWKPPKPERYEE